MVGPARGGGDKGRTTHKKRTFFEDRKKIFRKKGLQLSPRGEAGGLGS